MKSFWVKSWKLEVARVAINILFSIIAGTIVATVTKEPGMLCVFSVVTYFYFDLKDELRELRNKL